MKMTTQILMTFMSQTRRPESTKLLCSNSLLVSQPKRLQIVKCFGLRLFYNRYINKPLPITICLQENTLFKWLGSCILSRCMSPDFVFLVANPDIWKLSSNIPKFALFSHADWTLMMSYIRLSDVATCSLQRKCCNPVIGRFHIQNCTGFFIQYFQCMPYELRCIVVVYWNADVLDIYAAILSVCISVVCLVTMKIYK